MLCTRIDGNNRKIIYIICNYYNAKEERYLRGISDNSHVAKKD